MFYKPAHRVRAWLTGAGDLLLGAADPSEAPLAHRAGLAVERPDTAARQGPDPDTDRHATDALGAARGDADQRSARRHDTDARAADRYAAHPHRRPLRSERERRPGRVPARPAHCLSPVRRTPAARPIPFP